MNLVFLTGRLGRDPELRYTASDIPVCNFSLATDDGFGDKKKTNWHKIIAWKELAQNCGKYLKKGDSVVLAGRIDYRDWTDKEGNKQTSTEIVANRVEFPPKPKDTHVGGENFEDSPF